MLKSFPKIFALGTDYIADILQDEVEITEKIDGSQFCFGRVDGELLFRSKGAVLHADAPNDMFRAGVEYILSVADRIPDNTIFHGEFLNKPKHNTLAYDRMPKNGIALFSVSSPTDHFDKHAVVKMWADILEVDAVPLLWKGKIDRTEEILGFMDKPSYLGGANAEGVVVKNYHRPFLLGGQPIPVMSGKYVSEKFKEVHRKSWSGEHGPGRWDVFKDSFRTEARFDKAIQYLRDSGELTGTPKDIGKLIKRVMDDVTEEEKEAIKTWLWGHFGREVLSTAVKGLPEYYKLHLLKKLDQ